MKKPLQSPYAGPYRVLGRDDKVFKISINDQPTTVSIDRVKPAHFEDDTLQATAPEQQQRTPVAPKVYSNPKKKKIVTFALPAQALRGG